MEDERKKKHRILSDRVAIGTVGRSLTPEEDYAVWLLRERIHLQKAAALALAFKAALGNGRLPRKWFDATCDFPEQVDAEMYRVNSDRAEARTLAGMRR